MFYRDLKDEDKFGVNKIYDAVDDTNFIFTVKTFFRVFAYMLAIE